MYQNHAVPTLRLPVASKRNGPKMPCDQLNTENQSIGKCLKGYNGILEQIGHLPNLIDVYMSTRGKSLEKISYTFPKNPKKIPKNLKKSQKNLKKSQKISKNPKKISKNPKKS